MPQYRVGQRYLDEEEYAVHTFEMWSFYLFIIGAFAAGYLALQHVPSDWPKELRYISVISSGLIAGSLMGYFALYIRVVFFACLGLGAILGLLLWLWALV